MYKLCKTEQSAARQRQLEHGLLEAMSALRYEDITVSDLCDRMGIPRKSFYRYFSGMDGALHALIDHTLLEFEGFSASYKKDTRTLAGDLECFFLFWQEHRRLLDALDRSNMQGVLIQRAIDHAVSETGFPGRFLPGETREMQRHIVTFAICGMMTMVVQWHSRNFPETAREMAMVTQRLISQPLFPYAEKMI